MSRLHGLSEENMIRVFEDIFDVLAVYSRDQRTAHEVVSDIAWKVYGLLPEYDLSEQDLSSDADLLTLEIAKKLTSDGPLLYPGDDGY